MIKTFQPIILIFKRDNFLIIIVGVQYVSFLTSIALTLKIPCVELIMSVIEFTPEFNVSISTKFTMC